MAKHQNIHKSEISGALKTKGSLVKPQVNQKKCIACGACIAICPNKAIDWKNGKAWIDWKKCKGCLLCIPVCPVKAIKQ